jgi:hypothetical protein
MAGWLDFASAALNLGSSLYQGQQQEDAAQENKQAAEVAIQGIRDFESPSVEQLTATLQEYVSAGDLTPVQAIAILQEQSKLQNITVSPEVLQTQFDVMNRLSQIGKGGYTPEMMAGIQRAITEGDTASKGKRLAIADQYEQRGLGGSGNELLQKILATQDASNQANAKGLDVAEAAQKQALQALADSGIQANSMRTAQVNEQVKSAEAVDAINKFNAQNKQSAANTNTLNTNATMEANLKNRQDILNKNTTVAGQNAVNRAGAYQQAFDNALGKGKALVSANAPIANANTRQANADIASTQAYTNTANTLIKNYNEEEEKKKREAAAYTSQVQKTPEYNDTNMYDVYGNKLARGGQVPALKYEGGGLVTKTQQISKKDAIKLLDQLIPRRKFV